MTKQEYGWVRDRFLAALKALRDVEGDFAEIAHDTGKLDDDADIAEALTLYDSWLTADDLSGVKGAIACMERLVGRAHERAA